LQAYAGAFFAIPALRWLRLRAANGAIVARNAARSSAARLLRAPDAELGSKLAAARSAGTLRVLREEQAVYRTDRDLDEQPGSGGGAGGLSSVELSEFDRRLAQREQERRQQGR
jgi:hypothetical protein